MPGTLEIVEGRNGRSAIHLNIFILFIEELYLHLEFIDLRTLFIQLVLQTLNLFFIAMFDFLQLDLHILNFATVSIFFLRITFLEIVDHIVLLFRFSLMFDCYLA